MKATIEQQWDALCTLRRTGADDETIREAAGRLLFTLKADDFLPTAAAKQHRRAENACLHLLRGSDNRRYAETKHCTFFGCDLSRLFEHASLCADVLLSDCGYNLFFTGDAVFCGAQPTLLLSAYLNLIANAARFGKANDIFASLTADDDCGYLRVETKCSAALPANYKAGLRCVENVCRLHQGRLLLAADETRFCAVMAFSKALPWMQRCDVPLFSQYLSVRVSPVRIALCQVLP